MPQVGPSGPAGALERLLVTRRVFVAHVQLSDHPEFEARGIVDRLGLGQQGGA